MTLGQYITAVRLAIDWLTCGQISLDDLADFADGELALSELRANEVSPKTAARWLLRANGADWI